MAATANSGGPFVATRNVIQIGTRTKPTMKMKAACFNPRFRAETLGLLLGPPGNSPLFATTVATPVNRKPQREQ